MSKTIRTIGMIAGAVALAATGIGAVAGAAFAASALGSAVATAGTYATLISGVSGVIAGAMGPDIGPVSPARGSVTDVIVAIEPPSPYVMGLGYAGGVLRYDAGYGASLGSGENAIPNPYRFQVHCYSVGGPCDSLSPYLDRRPYTPGGWYDGYFWWDIEHGDIPAAAVTAGWPTPPGWNSTSAISGVATAGWSFGFDGLGEKFASGLPEVGLYGYWVRVYDPRLDSTQTAIGGSGPQRLDDETTWTWSENPALHAGTYAYGRYIDGKRVFGCGLTEYSADAISWADVAAWANVCGTNEWYIFGRIFEPGNRWENLRNICAAGGCKPYVRNGVLHFNYQTPRTALDTITSADIATLDGSVNGMRSRFERLNTIYPQYISPDHEWEMITATEAVTDAGYVAEDGQVRQRTWPFNLVKDKDQAAQLAAYHLADLRELSPIVLTCTERLKEYGGGDCLHLEIPELLLDTDAVVLDSEYDHASMTTRMVLIGETPAKHDLALGKTGTAPPTATLTPSTAQQRDQASAAVGKPYGWQLAIIRSAAIKNTRDDLDAERALLTATDAGASATISVAKHDWDYPSVAADLTRAGGTITGLDYGQTYYVYFNDESLTDASPTYAATIDAEEGQNTSGNPTRHPVGRITTPLAGAADTSSDQAAGYGSRAVADLEKGVNQDGTIRQDKVLTESLLSTSAHAVWAADTAGAVSVTTNNTWVTLQTLVFTSQGAPTLFDANFQANLQADGVVGTFPRRAGLRYRLTLAGDDSSSYAVSGASGGLIEDFVHVDSATTYRQITFAGIADYLDAGVTYTATLDAQYQEDATDEVAGLTGTYRMLRITELKKSQ